MSTSKNSLSSFNNFIWLLSSNFDWVIDGKKVHTCTVHKVNHQRLIILKGKLQLALTCRNSNNSEDSKLLRFENKDL